MHHAAVESRIAEFVARYTPHMAGDIVACRQKLRSLFPRGYELVFDNYNALVFGISPSERASDSFLSVAAYPRWVTLFFLYGATLADPNKILQGAGKQVRGIKLTSSADLDKPDVSVLIAQACISVAEDLNGAPPLHTVIKSVSAKQRPRRPSEGRGLRKPQAKPRETAPHGREGQ